jgi:hypothetical protein
VVQQHFNAVGASPKGSTVQGRPPILSCTMKMKKRIFKGSIEGKLKITKEVKIQEGKIKGGAFVSCIGFFLSTGLFQTSSSIICIPLSIFSLSPHLVCCCWVCPVSDQELGHVVKVFCASFMQSRSTLLLVVGVVVNDTKGHRR